MGKAQFLEFFDVLETMGPKARPSKNKSAEGGGVQSVECKVWSAECPA